MKGQKQRHDGAVFTRHDGDLVGDPDGYIVDDYGAVKGCREVV